MARRPSVINDGIEAELLFEFCVDGVALSAQSKNRARLRAWQEQVALCAVTALAGTPMLDGLIEIRLSEFSEIKSKDRDNFAKPIQDALQGILFTDDRHVARLVSDWCDINGRYKVRYMSKEVATALVAGGEFVWIRIYRHFPMETLVP